MSTPEPIAVIGIGCRFPGGANSPEKFWEILSKGRDTWSNVPEERFSWKSFHHPDGEAPGALNHLGGHFIDGEIAHFDGKFFGLPPQECEAIDPQFRFQLEVTCEALENAGLRLEDLRGSDTAVYVATFGQDYAHMQDRDLETISKYYMTGTGLAMASNRISYLLDLRGPSMTLDTGCSGSMVAIHQACQSLRTGETKIAVAGGVSLIITPDMMVPMSMIGRGAGYGRGEGAAMVVLKNLSDAIRDGDCIRGIIRNSGVNQDGKTPGITVPSRDAQLQLIRRVYKQANLNPLLTKYAEAHGTGTIAGDDAEIWALRQAFTSHDNHGSNEPIPLRVGTVKPNIGHLESASGAASLIKAILMLENDAMPPVINLEVLKDSCRGADILIPTNFEPWDSKTLRRISVNNFGYGGANGHLIVDSLSTYQQESGHHIPNGETKENENHQITNGTNPSNGINGSHPPKDVKTEPQVLALSAKSKESLARALENLEQWISQNPDPSNDALRNLAYTLSNRRSLFRWRCSLVGTSLPDLLSRLSLNRPPSVKSMEKIQNVFVFTGQGAQWFAMGRELMSLKSPYSKSLEASDKILSGFGAPWSLLEELLCKKSSDSRINESQIAQPATTAIQIALIDLLSSLDIKPDIVLGHSSGEIAAAYAAGSISQISALKAAYFRGRLQVSASLKGAMMAVGLGEVQLSQYLPQVKSGKLVIACSNSPESSTVSGDEAAILELKGILDTETVFARRLAVDTAYHSHHVMSVSDTYLHSLGGLEHGNTLPHIRFISSVTGKEMTTGFGPQYWVDNLVSKVQFQRGVEEVCRIASPSSPQARLSFIEVGPHSALSGPLRQTMSSLSFSAGFFCASVLIRNQDARYTLLEAVGKLFEQGCSVDIGKANVLLAPNKPRKLLVDLPTYSWDHSDTHWHESRLSKAHRFRKNPHHDLLGSRIASSTVQNPIWRHMLGIDRIPWLREHVIDGFMIFPASGYISMAIQALSESSLERHGSLDISSYNFRNVKFAAALLIPELSKSVEIQLSLTATENHQDNSKSRWEEFKVFSVSDQGTSTEHCQGYIMAQFSSESDEVEAAREQKLNSSAQVARLRRIESACKEELDQKDFYHDMEKTGNQYSGNFACIEKISLGGTQALSVLSIPDTSQCMPAQFQQPHVVHPATLDAIMHHPVAIINRCTQANSLMVVGIDDLKVSSHLANKPKTSLTLGTTTEGCTSRFPSADISVFQQGLELPVIQMKALKFRSTGDAATNTSENEDRNISYNMEWDLDADHMTSSMFSPGPDSVAAERAQEAKLQLLNQAAAIYVRSCVRELTVDGPPKLPGHFSHLFDWMKRFNQSDESRSLLECVSEANERSIAESAEKQGVEGELSQRLGPKMEDILTGKVDPLSLMIEDNLLYRIYSDDSSARIYAHVIKYMKKLAFKNPNVRVLELGGGTGATTAPLLEALGPDGILPFEKYVFTDVSSGFFERTRERLKKWDSYMEYKKLDMNSGFLQQGFENEMYDLIIGANCIHIASSMNDVMSNIRHLLKPGGKLVMIETTRVVPFYTTFMGVFDGWWSGK
ncbi:hypothetical protein HYFRA_00001298 [Hymenoscyphus fraxineus]|uniref:Polyketide synthase n=1 Tax=Hymenoscyphus fraxineus TaxID=746836 RepID=A0A9N9L809_9HELO|nr:hypothetical protein HYFRA_00001298 [Hymenoscyphus fraxineus]